MNLHDEIKALIALNTPGQVSETNRRLGIILELIPPKLCLGPRPAPVKKLFSCEHGENDFFVAYTLEECRRYFDTYVFENYGINRMEQVENGFDPEIIIMDEAEDFTFYDYGGLETPEYIDGTKTVAEWLADDPPCGFFASSIF